MSPVQIALFWPLVLRRRQFWRLLTSFFYGGQGITLLFNTLFLYRTSVELETQMFLSDAADYTWSLIMMAAAVVLFNLPLQSPILFHPMISALTYVWSVHTPDALVNLFGVITFEAQLLPLVNLGMDLVMGGPRLMLESATGLAAGFLWHKIRGIAPAGRSARPTPQQWLAQCVASPPAFLRRWIEGRRTSPSGRNVRQTSFGTIYTAREEPGSSQWSGMPGSFGSWFRSGQTVGSSGASRPSQSSQPRPSRTAGRTTNAQPDRDAILAATEARLRERSSSEK